MDVNGSLRILSAGDCMIRMPFETRFKHALVDDTVIYWATIDGRGAADFVKSFGYPRDVLEAGPCPAALFERIARGLLLRDSAAPRRLLPLYVELFVLAGGIRAESPDMESTLADRILFQCNTHYSELGFNIGTLADSLGIHRTTAARTMRRAVGKSPLEYLTALRLERGLDLLASTDCSVRSITEMIGFRQSCYFCRLVRRSTGMSPLEYRRRNQLKFLGV